MTLSKLQTIISKVAGVEVEITIRGEKKFTFSFEGKNDQAITKIKNYFKDGFKYGEESGYDEQCDYTCLFVEA